MQRRDFLGRVAQGVAATGAATLAGQARANSTSDEIRWALIGCGVRGSYLARFLNKFPQTRLVALADVFPPQAEKLRVALDVSCDTYQDFRRVLDREDVDTVIIATPDHWHAIPAVLACQAGKDVYVEKPLAHNIAEGRAIVDAARRHGRIVQTGMQHRSSPHIAQAAEMVQGGELGPIHFARIWNYLNTYPEGIGGQQDSDPPAGLDWDFYLGPAPYVPFNRNRFLWSFRWFWDYAGGRITDWGTHRFDSLHQIMGEDMPRSVSALGRHVDLGDGAETPHLLTVQYDYPSFVLSYEANQLNGHGVGVRAQGMKYYRADGPFDRPNGIALYGTQGTLYLDRIGLEVYPELEPGSRRAGSEPRFRMPRKREAARDETEAHLRNFIECVRSRERPVADAEIGHRSAIIPHLGNIAYRSGGGLKWDGEREEIPDDSQAARLLSRRPREKWNLLGS